VFNDMADALHVVGHAPGLEVVLLIGAALTEQDDECVLAPRLIARWRDRNGGKSVHAKFCTG
jgi:hypothetical protein